MRYSLRNAMSKDEYGQYRKDRSFPIKGCAADFGLTLVAITFDRVPRVMYTPPPRLASALILSPVALSNVASLRPALSPPASAASCSNSAGLSEDQAALLSRYADLFDCIESTPLTQEQRKACISAAPATLVLAGAGTGKTSTLTGRAAFLIAHQWARANDILCLAFAREAAMEIQDRVLRRLAAHWPVQDFSACTFHSLGLRIVRDVEGAAPVLSGSCGDPQQLCALIQKQLLHQMRQSDDYARLLFEYFAVIEPALALSCEYEERDSYQADRGIRLLRTIRGEVVRYPIECLVANALYAMNIDYDYFKHYPYPVYLRKRHPYRSTFYLRDLDVYLDVFDCTQQAGSQLPAAALAQRLARIHRNYGTRHFVLWEHPRYIDDVSQLLTCLKQNLHTCGALMSSNNTKANDACDNTKSRVARYRDCVLSLVGSGRWSALLQALGALLPLYLQRRTSNRETGSVPEPAKAYDRRRLKNLIALLQPLANAYQAHLQSNGEIDFDDMIQRATQYVASGRFIVPWSDILIDEFQDISVARFGLIAAMMRQRPQLRLFCVGDDWQAIYRFAGSDIRYSTHFAERVHPHAQLVPLSCTFRFGQALSEVSSRFLMKNPFQNQKQLYAARSGERHVVTVARQSDGLMSILAKLQIDAAQRASAGAGLAAKALQRCAVEGGLLKGVMKRLGLVMLSAIRSRLSRSWYQPDVERSGDRKPDVSVLILARFAHLLPDKTQLQHYGAHYPDLCISASTVHASKGLEADYVIVVNMEAGIYGFPANRPADKVVEYFLPQPEDFAYADERRLFYVAMTRARKHVWLLVPQEKHRTSEFVKELLRDNKGLVRTLGVRL